MRYISKLLILVFLYLISACFLHGQFDPDSNVRIRYRTLGWGVQNTFELGSTNQQVAVYRSHFSSPITYQGAPLLEFRQSSIEQFDDTSGRSEISQSEGSAQDNLREGTPVLARAQVPSGMSDVLFIFFKNNSTGGLPFRIAVVDDSLAYGNGRNVHFYNVSSLDLVVKAFDEVRGVPAGKQAIWELESSDSQSTLAIAVTNPEAKLVYSSRFRLRDNQRLTFMARQEGAQTLSDDPKIRVVSFLERVDQAPVLTETYIEP
ncbi:hypothetical protein [Rubellicoccus peritrichatus]|uniref:Uncharacterized protein n=1 Tax=Rubellicoccus peritrichatus TaxID=3080537 RepID=A0AAQ3L838_9BACT|nr:hypothetical protein [Puniceicoccus sp. CR14]WOO41030.1 hypothetical protein RZN69_20615 [Puniceicoccus sp. CR14]